MRHEIPENEQEDINSHVEKVKRGESVSNVIADLMIQYGPDGHCDGSDHLSLFFEKLHAQELDALREQVREYRQMIDEMVQACGSGCRCRDAVALLAKFGGKKL